MDGPRAARPGVPLTILAATLAVAAGATDVAAFARLGGVFSSVMTGNLTLLGLAASRTSGLLIAHLAVALGGYLLGAAAGSRVAYDPGRAAAAAPLWPARVTLTLGAELIPYLAFAVGWLLTGAQPAGGASFALLGLAALSMGMQAAAMRHVGVALSTTYMTGTLTGAITALARGGRPDRDTWLSIAVLLAHASGAAAAGGVILAIPELLPLLPIAALAAVVLTVRTVGVRR